LFEHFSEFSDYCKQDLEYARLAWAHLSPTKQDKPIPPIPEETDNWRLFTREKHNVDENSMEKLLRRQDPTQKHTEQLIMKDSIFSQTMMDSKCQIKVDDFMPGGRLSHIFIPNYVYVPPMAAEIINGHWVKRHQPTQDTSSKRKSMSDEIWEDSGYPNPYTELKTNHANGEDKRIPIFQHWQISAHVKINQADIQHCFRIKPTTTSSEPKYYRHVYGCKLSL
jgi:hypothetical protein